MDTGSSSSPGDPSPFQGRKILVLVTGGIAAYKIAYLVRDLAQSGADVRVAMTSSAHHFVGAQTFASLSGNPVISEMYGTGADVPHVELARGAALAIVAPATANVIAKMAGGFADDIVSATLLSSTCPILVAPAMHTGMWEHPATSANLATLGGRGVHVVGPSSGELSSGDFGPGRMAEPDEIAAAAAAVLGRGRDLLGRRVLVTAGGTQEPIDPVRFIGNRSSGLMGFTIARGAAARGAKVTLVTGPTELPDPPGTDVVRVRTAEEMRAAVLGVASSADAVIKAAAVADFRPRGAVGSKLKKADGPPEIELVPNPDILQELGSSRSLMAPGGILVGFAAETETDPDRLAELAASKREAKGADMIVANDVSSSDSGFGTRTNRAVIATAEGVRDVGLATKESLAEAILDEIAAHLGGADRPPPGSIPE
jgi:phosphopantothenoylcysteine decarboxylase/phosphopantothenate--cysteine ligase